MTAKSHARLVTGHTVPNEFGKKNLKIGKKIIIFSRDFCFDLAAAVERGYLLAIRSNFVTPFLIKKI